MNSDIGNGRANEQNQFSPVTKKMKRHTAASFDYTEYVLFSSSQHVALKGEYVWDSNGPHIVV